ncbi:hexokinase type 2 [Caerostris extrusa]|uniref:Phosphotransferase n=1 Tax=Caerostris extrusa TaxID=172846 RepID=A0AAV4RU01_CAEEX|nr:hexokinase type 2 [Caerostris extrusa]
MNRNVILQNVGEDLQFNITPEPKIEKIKSITDPYLLSDDIIKHVNEIFEEELELGLKKNPKKQSSLQMANTFVPKLLSGHALKTFSKNMLNIKKEIFLHLILEEPIFRVILLKLDPERELDCIVKYYTVPDTLRLGEGELLFEFLAECMHNFLEEKGLLGKKLPLGFCFSFPMIQTGVNEGILVTWTKSFKCKNVVGKEVVQMLNHAFSEKQGVDVDVVAIINDATGTMMMGSYIDKRSAIGMILGTGCNAAYFERVSRIEKWEGKHPGIDEVIIDIEWGAFGDNGVLDFMKTDIDKEVDQASLLVNSFTFEKLFAGKYIGEIVRRVLNQLIDKNVLAKSVQEDWKFTAADVSDTMEESNLEKILKNMKTKGFAEATLEDAEIVHYVCTVISIRGALLVSICLSSLLRRMNKEDATIAVDGSLFKHHPKYDKYMEKFIATLAPNKSVSVGWCSPQGIDDMFDVIQHYYGSQVIARCFPGPFSVCLTFPLMGYLRGRDKPRAHPDLFQFILAEDGSGKGAGLVAAVVTSLDTSGLHV